jgi:hypothetical protein
MTRAGRSVYICRVCHLVGLKPLNCHPGNSVVCDAGEPGDERSKPLFDRQGRLVTRAPKWWVDECFQGKGGEGYTGNQVYR